MARLTVSCPIRENSLRTARSNTDMLLLDSDGMICATAPAIRFSLKTAFFDHRVDLPNPRRIEIAIGSGLTLPETIQFLHPSSSVSLEEVCQLERRYREAYSSEGCQYEVLVPGAEATLEECARHAKIVVLSSKGLKAIEAAITVCST